MRNLTNVKIELMSKLNYNVKIEPMSKLEL